MGAAGGPASLLPVLSSEHCSYGAEAELELDELDSPFALDSRRPTLRIDPEACCSEAWPKQRICRPGVNVRMRVKNLGLGSKSLG